MTLSTCPLFNTKDYMKTEYYGCGISDLGFTNKKTELAFINGNA